MGRRRAECRRFCLRPDQLGKQGWEYQTYRADPEPQEQDFVFIDDRADEREMVNMAMPEVLALDATSDRAWHLLDLWSRFLPARAKTDRTQFYKQKEQRDGFLQEQTAVVEDQGKLSRSWIEDRRARLQKSLT